MNKTIKFSKFFIPAAVLSSVLVIAGIAGYFAKGGFNLGVDFQAGLIQEIRFAPTAFSVSYGGLGNATISFDRSNLYIVTSGAGVEGRTIALPYSEYRTIGALGDALESQIEGLSVTFYVSRDTNTQWLIHSAQGNPYLSDAPYIVHYQDPQSPEISIATVRESMTSLGQTVSVQSLGSPSDRHFMIRLEDRESEAAGISSADKIIDVLEGYFGSGEIAVLRSDYVGSRFSKDLTDQAGYLMGLTLLLILAYASVRFKPKFAVAAVVGIIHCALIMIAYVVWTGMEFNTSTIAAVLTILGYSINNTIVVFDRVRENLRISVDDPFVDILDRSITETLSRTIITTLTTMLAVLSLYIFTTGSMKDFAMALIVGLVSGVYTTTFIASGIVYLWETKSVKRQKQKLAPQSAKAAVSR